jgi:hypothetical protein
MHLKPLDLFVCLKIAISMGEPRTYAQLALEDVVTPMVSPWRNGFAFGGIGGRFGLGFRA